MEVNGFKIALFNNEMPLSERKREVCQSSVVAEEVRNDVLKRYYGIDSNHCRPLVMEKINLNRIITKHGDNGVINLSACRSNLPQEVNDEQTQELLHDIQSAGYAYLPTYGGYRDTSKGEEADYEPSFIVFNYNTKGEPQQWEKLKQFGIEMCRKYDQSSVLVKAPGENPVYLDGNGRKINSSETDKVFKNDANQEFFTTLKNKQDVDKEIDDKLMTLYHQWQRKTGRTLNAKELEKFKQDNLDKVKNIGRRYTYDIKFDECVLVNPGPATLMEQMLRSQKGEIMLWDI